MKAAAVATASDAAVSPAPVARSNSTAAASSTLPSRVVCHQDGSRCGNCVAEHDSVLSRKTRQLPQDVSRCKRSRRPDEILINLSHGAVGDDRAGMVEHPAQQHRQCDADGHQGNGGESGAGEDACEERAQQREAGDPETRGKQAEQDRQQDPAAQSAGQFPQTSVEIHALRPPAAPIIPERGEARAAFSACCR